MGLFDGSLLRAGAGALFRNLTRRNATPEEDWAGAVRTLGLEAAVRRYPQQAALYGGIAPGMPGAGSNYPLPVPYATQQAFSPPAQQAALPISYTPVMGAIPPLTALPQIGAAAGAVARGAMGMLPATVRAGLPVLSRRIAQASGWLVLGGLIYDAAGNLMGRARRRRRLNPLNYRAAMRAVRRLQKLHQFNTALDQCMPTRRTSRKSWPKRKTKRNCK